MTKVFVCKWCFQCNISLAFLHLGWDGDILQTNFAVTMSNELQQRRQFSHKMILQTIVSTMSLSAAIRDQKNFVCMNLDDYVKSMFDACAFYVPHRGKEMR